MLANYSTTHDGIDILVNAMLAAPLLLENETGMYELQAVVTHRGRVADSGHYVAWVKHPSGMYRCATTIAPQLSEPDLTPAHARTYVGQWLLFDDDTVTPVPVEDIRSLTGAGGGTWCGVFYVPVRPRPKLLVVCSLLLLLLL